MILASPPGSGDDIDDLHAELRKARLVEGGHVRVGIGPVASPTPHEVCNCGGPLGFHLRGDPNCIMVGDAVERGVRDGSMRITGEFENPSTRKSAMDQWCADQRADAWAWADRFKTAK